MKIREAILVEGRYDKAALAGFVDAVIVTAEGFSIFNNADKRALLQTLARKTGLIILTDSDPAGFLIRNKLKDGLPPELVKHAYVPAIKGKERRKDKPSAAGLLGVEGMDNATIENSLRRAGATILGEDAPPVRSAWLTKAKLYELGLSGRPDAALLREKLLKRMDFPVMSANALIAIVNLLYSQQEFCAFLTSAEPTHSPPR